MKYVVEGKILDDEKGEKFVEKVDWDGRNMISRATGTQFEHEEMHATAKGTLWIDTWTDYQGDTPTARIVDAREAALWLLNNGYDEKTAERVSGIKGIAEELEA